MVIICAYKISSLFFIESNIFNKKWHIEFLALKVSL